MTYKHYKRLKALGFPVENFSILDIFRKKPKKQDNSDDVGDKDKRTFKKATLTISKAKPLSDDFFNEYEQEYNIKIPSNIRSIIKKYNGVSFRGHDCFVSNTGFTYTIWDFNDFNLDYDAPIKCVVGGKESILIPFANLEMNELACLDITNGGVAVFSPAYKEIKNKWSSFDSFLKSAKTIA